MFRLIISINISNKYLLLFIAWKNLSNTVLIELKNPLDDDIILYTLEDLK